MHRLACSFGVLGPLTVVRGTEPVVIPAGRQRKLLALLLHSGGEPVSRDRLIDELWGERPPSSAVSALHGYLSKLRSQLDGVLISDGSGYRLDRSRYELDLDRFERLVAAALSDPAKARTALEEALDLWRGEPLSDIEAEGRVAEWQRELTERHTAALLLRIDADLAAGSSWQLVAELERLIVRNPVEERAWGQLMLALYRAGRPADALEAFQRARRSLSEELGIDPGQPLSRLEQRILDRDPGLMLSAAESEPPAPRRASLPSPLRRLVGREAEMSALAALMVDPDARLVTLVGPGGVGKTRLLLELARTQEPQHADGAVFVRLERLTAPSQVIPEIARAVARHEGSDGPSADELAAHLSRRDMLLAIDNFEHVLSAATELAELLSTLPGVRVVVSSRVPLRVRGEQLFELDPLGLPDGHQADELQESPAVQLYLQCALAADRRFAVDSSTVRTIGDICRALDGLPLAIELAAARSDRLTPAEIADQLTDPLTIGRNAVRDLPDRQQTLDATIRWSYDLLSADARAALRRASVFLGGFSRAALAEIAGAGKSAAIEELLDARLVRRQARRGRFELSPLIRAFAVDELQTRDQADTVRAHHRRYFVGLASSAAESFKAGVAPGEIAQTLAPDRANIRAALEDAIVAEDKAAAITLLRAMTPMWIVESARREATETVDRLIGSLDLSPTEQIPLLLGINLTSQGTPEADRLNRRIAEVARETGDLDAQALATFNLFASATNSRDRRAISSLGPELATLVARAATPRIRGFGNYFLALDAYIDSRLAPSAHHAALAEQCGREIGHAYLEAGAAFMALIARSAIKEQIVHEDLRRVVALMQAPAVPQVTAEALWLVGRYAVEVAPAEAAQWLVHAERIAAGAVLWPESAVLDESLHVLGVASVADLSDVVPVLDHVEALTAAIAWLDRRDSSEVAPRDSALAARVLTPRVGSFS